MATSYDVRIWAIQVRRRTGSRGKSVGYVVRWMVGGKRHEKWFKIRAQADSFRSDLMSAAKNGSSFDVAEGLPAAMLWSVENVPMMSWFEFACVYADYKWDEATAPKSRKTTADSLIPITLAMLTNEYPGEFKMLARALRCAFNKNQRSESQSGDVADALRWGAHNTRPVIDIAEPSTLRAVLGALDKNRNGRLAATDTIRLRRMTLRNALDYAIELELLDRNPMTEVKGRKQKTVVREVDRRSVANPVQARSLLWAVGGIKPELVAFFAVMYFAALRPEEAVNLRKRNLSLPEEGWGEIYLERAAPEIGAEWTDSGEREQRSLKHREDGASRPVPCPPELTRLLHQHVATYGTTPDGRLFRAVRGDGWLSSTVYGRTWAKARDAAFTPEVVASPLAKRPYDLRHAAVSTWLNAGVEATRVAEWAGHSVAVLLRVYAKCLDGGEQDARRRVAYRLGGS